MKFLKLITLFFVLQGCSSSYEWGWYILSPENIEGLTNLKFLISGITTTIQGSISVGSTILSLVGFGTVDTGFTSDNVVDRLNAGQFTSTPADFGARLVLVLVRQEYYQLIQKSLRLDLVPHLMSFMIPLSILELVRSHLNLEP